MPVDYKAPRLSMLAYEKCTFRISTLSVYERLTFKDFYAIKMSTFETSLKF